MAPLTALLLLALGQVPGGFTVDPFAGPLELDPIEQVVPRKLTNRDATPPPLPTGVVPPRRPRKSGVVAHGTMARAFVAAALDVGHVPAPSQPDPTPTIPDLTGRPFLALVGPADATDQIARQLPEDVSSAVHVRRYDPADKVDLEHIRRLGVAAGGSGVRALVKAADGSKEYDAAFDLAEVLRVLRRLLGVAPEPDPWTPLNPLPKIPPFPFLNPGLTRWVVTMCTAVGFLLGCLTGWGIPRTIKAAVSAFMGLVRSAVREVGETTAPRPNG